MSENKAETNKNPKEKPAPKEFKKNPIKGTNFTICLLYTSDAADE